MIKITMQKPSQRQPCTGGLFFFSLLVFQRPYCQTYPQWFFHLWREWTEWSQLYILCKFVPSIVSPLSQIHTVSTPQGFISLPLVLSLLSSYCIYFSIIPQCFNFSNFLFIYFPLFSLCVLFPFVVYSITNAPSYLEFPAVFKTHTKSKHTNWDSDTSSLIFISEHTSTVPFSLHVLLALPVSVQHKYTHWSLPLMFNLSQSPSGWHARSSQGRLGDMMESSAENI